MGLGGRKAPSRDDNSKGPTLRHRGPRPRQGLRTWKERGGFKGFLQEKEIPFEVRFLAIRS